MMSKQGRLERVLGATIGAAVLGIALAIVFVATWLLSSDTIENDVGFLNQLEYAADHEPVEMGQ